MKTRVYDLPTRLFHWLFTLFFVAAFFIAILIDDNSWFFTYHMFLGLVLCFIVLLRVIWGLFGSHYSRFSSFPLGLPGLKKYFSDLFTKKTELYFGHNPASAWAAFMMMLFAVGLGYTGYLLTTGFDMSDWAEEAHEYMAYALAFVAVFHVFGLMIHSMRHRDSIGLSMVSGFKYNPSQNEFPAETKSKMGLVFVLLVLLFIGFLVRNFDSNTGRLSILGKELQLSEDKTN
jgi:cytochrome b